MTKKKTKHQKKDQKFGFREELGEPLLGVNFEAQKFFLALCAISEDNPQAESLAQSPLWGGGVTKPQKYLAQH